MRRGRLISLAPLGLGTAQVESLSSYVRRLAQVEVRLVSDLLTHFVLTPLMQERGQRHPMFQPTRVTEAINGSGRTTTALVERLVMLTGVDDIAACTLGGGAEGIELREAWREQRAWCPTCLREDEVPYDRLTWALTPTRCKRHSAALISRCGICGRSHRPWHRSAHPVRCAHCASKLSASRARQHRGAAPRLTDLVALAQTGVLTRDRVAAGFAHVIADLGGLARTSATLGVSRSELCGIRRGEVRPHLALFLRALDRSGSSAEVFLSRPRMKLAQGRGGRPSRERSDRMRLQRRLHRLLVRRSDLSLRALARRLATTPARLRALSPQLTEGHLRRLRVERQRRRALAAEKLGRAVTGAVAVAARSGVVRRRVVERILGRGGVLRSAVARRAYQEAQRSHPTA